MRLPINQRGAAQILLPLFLLAAIGLTVYLAQQPTDLAPSAAEVPTLAPQGCTKVSPGRRLVQYKNCQSASENCGTVTPLTHSQAGEQDINADYKFPPPNGAVVAGYPLKETVWEFGSWKLHSMKGPRQSDGDRTTISESRFDGPDGKSYTEVDDDPAGANREATRIVYREKGGSSTVVEFAYTKSGTNYQGLPGTTYDMTKSFAFVPNSSGTKCDGTGTTAGTKNTGEACTGPGDCKSGSCTNRKCDAQGSKAGGATCEDGPECQSGSCTNGKCAGGSRTVGQTCDSPSECASNKCTANRCVAATSSTTPSSTPRASTPGGTASTSPSASTPAASTPTASTPSTSSSPAASVPGGSTPTSLTKAEITGFRNSYNALAARLGTASNSGNLKVVSGIAGSELNSIVAQLPTCPDDANVGSCLDTKFRTRFDFAKTAARLTAFYAIFNNISGLCVKSDFGLNPLITATSSTNTQGRVNLCTEPTAAQKIWRIFASGKFEPMLATDTRWPANPTCGTLPPDVLTHYRNAETLFSTQAGFTSNTLCDGKTTAEAPGGSEQTTTYSSETSCNGSCPLSTSRCGISRIDSEWYCLPKGIFNKDFHCTSLSGSEFGNTCPSNYSACDPCGQCRNASNQILPGTPNPQEGLCRP